MYQLLEINKKGVTLTNFLHREFYWFLENKSVISAKLHCKKFK